jgi:MoxR-like ATPase
MGLTYKRLFDPDAPSTPRDHAPLADRAARQVYVFDEYTILAVNVAMATGRPLLIRGESGVGKSSLAGAVAHHLGWDYVETVVTSRTEAKDLLYKVDLLRRLQDAQAERLDESWKRYVEPGPVWWAFDHDLAAMQQKATGLGRAPSHAGPDGRVVLLVDEVDKAEPDVPNNLLRPVGSLEFEVPELDGLRITARAAPLLFITTNEERDLPPAFLRRCVELVMAPPSEARLIEIGRAHHPEIDENLLSAAAAVSRAAPAPGASGRPPSAAEYLDLLRACRSLDIAPDSEAFEELAAIAARGAAPARKPVA